MKKNSKLGIKGFTLTEVLLAVMIIGLIGVALASLTRAASRESALGRSRIMLRNNAAIFIRQLRRDMEQATKIIYVKGPISSVGSDWIPLLKLIQGSTNSGDEIVVNAWAKDSNTSQTTRTLTRTWITYCFAAGATAAEAPKDGGKTATIGGTIYRLESKTEEIDCTGYNTVTTQTTKILTNVKYIPSDLTIHMQDGDTGFTYPVPLFAGNTKSSSRKSLLNVNIITELNSKPVINDAMEETLTMPMGY